MKKTHSSPRVPLGPTRIYQTALDLIERTSVEDLSMRKLAAELGVDAMSIYHHVANKQALLIGVYQMVLDELELPDCTHMSWQDNLRELARRFFRLARRYPKVIPHLISSPYGTPRELEIYQHIRTVVARTGLDQQDQVRATAALYTYAIGMASVAINGLSLRPLYLPEAQQQPPKAEHHCSGSEDDFDFNVELLIKGIEQTSRGNR
jgi:AcrR family transcriptional regulator